MTKFKLSSRFHILIIISALIVAIGLAVGLVCQFVANGYFNYGAEYKSYQSVVVNYAYVDLSDFGDEEGVKEICDEQFGIAGVSYYNCSVGETSGGGELTYKFSSSTDSEKLTQATKAIHDKLNGGELSHLSNAYLHEVETELGGGKAYVYGSIALASAIVFQFLYFAIRYRLTMAFAALLANVHNAAIYVSLVAITRIPVGSSVFTFGALTVVITMIGCALLFGTMRKSLKDESFAKLDVNEQVDTCTAQSLKTVCSVAVFVAVAAVAVFVLLAISALSVATVVTPAVLALICAASSVYGTAFFTPAVYSRFKKIGDDFKANRSSKKKADKKS